MAKTKSGGSSGLGGRDSAAQRLGIKIYAGEKVAIGNVIVKQRGTKVLAGKNVSIGRDDTIYAAKNGVVKFTETQKKLFNGKRRLAKVVSVVEEVKAEKKSK